MLNVAIEGYPFRNRSNKGPEIFMKRLSDSIQKQKLASVRRTIFPFYDIALFKISASSLYRKPFALRVDGLYVDKKNTIGESVRMNEAIFRSMSKADGLIFISDYCKKIAEALGGEIRKPYKIIHNAVDTKLFTPDGDHFRETLGFSRKDKVIVVSALWRRHKRLKETVKLFKKLRDGSPVGQNYKLVVIGGQADHVEADKDIRYVGQQDHAKLPAWYRTGDLYVHLSWIEPCGNTQIEAMACGLPVLCTNNGGVGETVKRANGGIVSKADQEYMFEMVDYYHPPEPNYDILLSDIRALLDDVEYIKNRIDYSALNIDVAAKTYVGFLEKIVRKQTAGILHGD